MSKYHLLRPGRHNTTFCGFTNGVEYSVRFDSIHAVNCIGCLKTAAVEGWRDKCPSGTFDSFVSVRVRVHAPTLTGGSLCGNATPSRTSTIDDDITCPECRVEMERQIYMAERRAEG